MIHTLLQLFCIQLIICIVTDMSDFWTNVESLISKWLKVKSVHIKILECSFCQTFWCSLLYLLVTNNVTLYYIAIVLLMAYMNPVLVDICMTIRDTASTIINYINNKIN